MKAKIVRIGNSKGIRLPKTVLEQCNLQDEVVMEVQGNTLLIQNANHARAGWEVEFRKMRHQGDDELLDQGQPLKNDWDEEEWEWK